MIVISMRYFNKQYQVLCNFFGRLVTLVEKKSGNMERSTACATWHVGSSHFLGEQIRRNPRSHLIYAFVWVTLLLWQIIEITGYYLLKYAALTKAQNWL